MDGVCAFLCLSKFHDTNTLQLIITFETFEMRPLCHYNTIIYHSPIFSVVVVVIDLSRTIIYEMFLLCQIVF